jgi:hypothetical protein
MPDRVPTEDTFPEVEELLRPLAEPLPAPQPGDWLAEHRERGQTFRRYLAARPVRRDLLDARGRGFRQVRRDFRDWFGLTGRCGTHKI